MGRPIGNTHRHKHDFIVAGDDAFVYEDGAMHVFEECTYVEQSRVGHSQRLDEAFYETMYECDESRSRRFDLTGIEKISRENTDAAHIVAEGADAFEIEEGMDTLLFEKIVSKASQRLTGNYEGNPEPLVLEWFDRHSVDSGPHFVDIEGLDITDSRYRLRYEEQ